MQLSQLVNFALVLKSQLNPSFGSDKNTKLSNQ
jgi:hypothetical protein